MKKRNPALQEKIERELFQMAKEQGIYVEDLDQSLVDATIYEVEFEFNQLILRDEQ